VEPMEPGILFGTFGQIGMGLLGLFGHMAHARATDFTDRAAGRISEFCGCYALDEILNSVQTCAGLPNRCILNHLHFKRRNPPTSCFLRWLRGLSTGSGNAVCEQLGERHHQLSRTVPVRSLIRSPSILRAFGNPNVLAFEGCSQPLPIDAPLAAHNTVRSNCGHRNLSALAECKDSHQKPTRGE